MHDVAVTLNDHQVLHPHAAEIAHAPDVVARQIHEHHVLGTFLWVGQQFLFQCRVFRVRFAAPPRAGNGADFHPAILATHVNFR